MFEGLWQKYYNMHVDTLTNEVYFALNKELMRRMIIKYFHDKGLKENMDAKLYPPTLQDLPLRVPHLLGKLEIQPFVEDVDPINGIVTLGWNLFLLGNKRMFLGESTHKHLSEIQVNIAGPMSSEGISTVDYVTPRKVVTFIVEVMGTNKSCDLAKLSHVANRRNVTPVMGQMLSNAQAGFFQPFGRPVL